IPAFPVLSFPNILWVPLAPPLGLQVSRSQLGSLFSKARPHQLYWEEIGQSHPRSSSLVPDFVFLLNM
uniref:Uncharacterized protein n=1 Tax=Cannabis sativa TaxID=3483 RepID=A0A803NIE2_CANSA